MSGKPVVFVDTNIWLYAFLDTGEEEKSLRASEDMQDGLVVRNALKIINPFK